MVVQQKKMQRDRQSRRFFSKDQSPNSKGSSLDNSTNLRNRHGNIN